MNLIWGMWSNLLSSGIPSKRRHVAVARYTKEPAIVLTPPFCKALTPAHSTHFLELNGKCPSFLLADPVSEFLRSLRGPFSCLAPTRHNGYTCQCHLKPVWWLVSANIQLQSSICFSRRGKNSSDRFPLRPIRKTNNNSFHRQAVGCLENARGSRVVKIGNRKPAFLLAFLPKPS